MISKLLFLCIFSIVIAKYGRSKGAEIVCEDQARYRKLCPSFASDCKTDPKMKLACPKTCGVCKNEPLTLASMYKEIWLNTATYKFHDLTVNAKLGNFTAWADSLDQNKWMKLWSYFNPAIGDEVSQDEFSNALKTLQLKSNKMDVTSFLDTLGKTNFWKAAGFNVNDSLGYENFKGVMTALAIVDAQTIIQTFDANRDTILDENETLDFFVFRGYKSSNGSLLVTADHNTALETAWSNKVDNSPKTTQKEAEKFIEAVAEFVIAEWSLLIDYGILTIDDGSSEDGAIEAENYENFGNVGNVLMEMLEIVLGFLYD